MSKTPTSMFASASPRPYADAFGGQFGSGNMNATGWAHIDTTSTEHLSTVGCTESKRLNPGSFAGVLT